MTLDVNRPDLVVGVVGTGAMGRGIAQVTAQGGMKAIMFDAAAGGAAKAKAAILETLKGLVAKGRLTDADLAKTDANLAVADKLDDLKACHVVVEAVFENLEVKQKLFGELEAVVAARDHPRLQHLVDPHRLDRALAEAPRARLRHALFQSRAADEARRGDPRRRHRALGDRRHGGAGQAPDARARGGGRHAGLSGQSRRHRHRHRGPAHPAGGQGDALAGRRRDARLLRLPHGPVRADGPHRHRRELPGAQDHLRGLLPRPPHDAQPLSREPLCGGPARPQDRRRLVRLRRQGRQGRSRRRSPAVGRAGDSRRGDGQPQREAGRPGHGGGRAGAGRRRRQKPHPGGADRQGLHHHGRSSAASIPGAPWRSTSPATSPSASPS